MQLRASFSSGCERHAKHTHLGGRHGLHGAALGAITNPVPFKVSQQSWRSGLFVAIDEPGFRPNL